VLGFAGQTVPDVWLLYVLTAVQLGLSGIFNPTKDSILPDVTRSEELGSANALNASTWSTMLALGAALGGLVAGEWGLAPAFIIDSLSFIISGALIAGMAYRPVLPERKRLQAGDILAEYLGGFRYLRSRPEISLIVLQKAFQTLAVSSGFQIIQVTLSSRVFVIGDGAARACWMYAVIGLGTGAGPILARRYTATTSAGCAWRSPVATRSPQPAC
jgi:MFS family permease